MYILPIYISVGNAKDTPSMKIYCPYTIGTSRPIQCVHGMINNQRCPFWQQDGHYVHVENLMNSPIVMESALCKYIPEIIRDFEVVGNYRWYCTQWPGIREKTTTCMLQDALGKKYTVDEVISKYTKNEIVEEVIPDDGEEEEQRSSMYH